MHIQIEELNCFFDFIQQKYDEKKINNQFNQVWFSQNMSPEKNLQHSTSDIIR